MFTLTDYELNTFLFEERYIYDLVKRTRSTYIERFGNVLFILKIDKDIMDLFLKWKVL